MEQRNEGVAGTLQVESELRGQGPVLDPDVILMDLGMPDLDGVSAITRLTDSGSRARVLVLFQAVRAAARGEAFDRGLLVPGNQG